jgi:hypothetical protein
MDEYMKQSLFILALAAGLAASPGVAVAAPPAGPHAARLGEEARIPFVSFRSIRTYRAVGDDVVFIQDLRRNWYRATLFGPCFNLGRSLRIGVDTRYGNTLDSTSSFVVGGERCRIQSLVHSEPPPPRRRAR